MQLRHGADDALIHQADDNGDDHMRAIGDDHGDRAAEIGDDRGGDDGVAPTAAGETAPAPAPAAIPTAGQAGAIALSVVEGPSPQGWTYAPAQVTAAIGTMLTWTNTGAEDHTVTSDDRTSFDSHNLSPNGTLTFTPSSQ